MDVSKGLRAVLRRLRAQASAAAFRRGETSLGWLFPASDEREPMPHGTAHIAFKRALKAAELPGHFSYHSLRHTYARKLLIWRRERDSNPRSRGHRLT